MMWPFFRRRLKPGSEAGRLESGVHRSPGLAMISEEFRSKKPRAILDLGASSTENFSALSAWSDDFVVQDCFHSAGASDGQRAEAFDFGSAEEIDLPDDSFDLVFLWDLLHYFNRSEATAFVARLAKVTAAGGLVLVHASAITPIPPTPIQFKIVADDRLEYVLGTARLPTPGLNTRTIERMMAGFTPLRVLQLRNGLQELVFQRQAEPTLEAAVIEDPPAVWEP